MKVDEILGLVVRLLDEIDIPYMLTGSLAGSFHGAPRATQDIDLVVDAELADLLRLADGLRGVGMYVSDDAIREAVDSRGLFNAIDSSSGWKIDFIVRKERRFSREEFSSRQTIQFMGLDIDIARAEDMVLAKLEWSKLGDSERQLKDVAEIVSIQGARLDLDHIEGWVVELELREQWLKAKDLAESPPGRPD